MTRQPSAVTKKPVTGCSAIFPLSRTSCQVAVDAVWLLMQELHVFLEAEAPLGSNLQWQQLQPMHGSILEGMARLPKQLFGMLAALLLGMQHAP